MSPSWVATASASRSGATRVASGGASSRWHSKDGNDGRTKHTHGNGPSGLGGAPGAAREAQARLAREGSPASPPAKETFAILCFGLCVFLAVALVTYRVSYVKGASGENLCGWVGHTLAGAGILLLGTTVYIPLAFAAVWSGILLVRHKIESPLVKAFGVVVLTLSLGILLEHRQPYGVVPGDPRGGLLGTALAPYVANGFGTLGTYLVLMIVAALAFTMATDYAFVPLIREALLTARRASDGMREAAMAVKGDGTWGSGS